MKKIFLLLFGIIFLTYSASAYYCYQESANTTNQTGIDGNCGLNYNGVYANDSSTYLYVNYTVPSGVITPSLLEVAAFGQADIGNWYNRTNLTLSLLCMANNKAQIRISPVGHACSNSINIFCYNQTGWQTLLSHSEGRCGTYVFGAMTNQWYDGNWGTHAGYSSDARNTVGWGVLEKVGFYEEAVWWNMTGVYSIVVSPVAPLLFSSYNVSANLTVFNGTTANLSVTLPSGVKMNYSLSNVSDVFSLNGLNASLNGTYLLNVSASNGNSMTSSFTVYDNQIISPTSYSQTVAAGSNYSFSVSLNTNLTSGVLYNISCFVPTTNMSCNVQNNISVITNGSFIVIINTSSSIANGLYNGSLNITRQDGRVVSIPLSLGILNLFGQPVILNMSNILVTMYSNTVQSASFTLLNNGTNNLSSCVGSLDSSFVGWSFYTFSNVSLLPVNESATFNVTFSSPPVGAYAGYFQLTCIAGGGLYNSLDSANRPIITLSSNTPQVNTGGGGGGGGYVPSPLGGNDSFTLETDSGGSSSALYFYPGQSRDISLVLTSLITSDQDISLSCVGDFCSNVVLSKNGVLLSGKDSGVVLLSMKVPVAVPYGKKFVFSIIAKDSSSNTRSLDVQIEVAQIASFVNKFALQVQPGDEGYLVTVGDFNVPKIIFYILFVGIIEVVLAWTIPSKGSGGRNPRVFWMPLIGIFAAVLIVLIV